MKEKTGFWWSSPKINLDNLKDIFFLSILLFLPTQFGRHFWPDFSYVKGIRIDYLSPTLYFTDILTISLFILFIFSLKDIRLKFKVAIGKHVAYYLPLAILVIGIIFSKNPLSGWYGLLKLLEFIFFGFYTALSIKKFKFSTILYIFSISILFESFLALFQFLNQGSLGGIFYFFGERDFNGQTPGIANASLNGQLILRPYGTFSHPNVLAGFLLIEMIVLIYNLNYNIKALVSWTAIIALSLGTVALFLTMERVAILLWIFIIILLGIKNFYRKKKVFYFLLPFILISIAVLLPTFYLRFTNLNFSDQSFVLRGELIKESLIMIKNQPIFGTGINNFLYNLPDFYLQPVHNIYLLIATQTGILGLIFFLWFIIKAYRNLRFTIYDLRFTILTSVLILGFFDHYFLTLQQGQLLFSFVLGLSFVKIHI